MPFLGRAFFNLLSKNTGARVEDVQEWQIRNYRNLSIDELVTGLEELGVEIDVEQFSEIAEDVDSPEEIAASIAPPGEPRDRVYLYIFELWRRLLDDRETISIFCDELDLAISSYEEDPLSHEELIYGMLKELVGILEENTALGQKPQPLFEMIASFLSNDLESFIYNYIQDLIEQDRQMVAQELASNFIPYVKQTLWFDWIKIKLLFGVPSREASAILARFLEKLQEKPDIDLYFELLYHLNKTGLRELFSRVYRQAFELSCVKEEIVELLEILAEFKELNDRSEEAKEIRSWMETVQKEDKRIQETKEKMKLSMGGSL